MQAHFVGSQLDFVGSLLDCVPWATANLCQEFQKWQKFGKTNIFLCSPFTSQNFYPFKSCLKNFPDPKDSKLSVLLHAKVFQATKA